LGLLHPAEGSVQLLGLDVRTGRREIRSRVGYMPEGACLPLDQSAADFVAYSAELAGLPTSAARRRSSEALTLVGLAEERFRYLGDFSTGMFQRVKLAQAIVHDPEVVFLDEPASGLDPDGRQQMLDLINRLGDFGISVVFSTHIIDDIEKTCEWVVMLDGGQLRRNGPLSRLGTHGVIRLEVIGDRAAVAAGLTEAGATVTAEPSHLVVRGGDDSYRLIRDVVASVGAGIRLMREAEVTLEEAFFIEPSPPPVPEGPS
ncbi:MAG: ABC transporter ATP-binding protein, partial [Acidimicrobiia bacterium]|nr:ABC transporter ATP-binding protein [Acidimicrobiia bacterium]